MLKCSLNIILLVAYIECHTGHEIDDTRTQSKMIGDDVSKQGCRIAIFGMNSHMWLNHFLPFALELQGNKAFYTITVLIESVAYMYI